MTDGERHTTRDDPRLDVNGVEWFACDPYPTWFRWENMDTLSGELILGHHVRWADEDYPLPPEELRAPEDCYGHDNHRGGCDGRITERPPGGGVACKCRARWFCL